MNRYVLDTSVVVKWFTEYNEDDIDAAISLREDILEGRISIVIPDLLFYELSNALRYNSAFDRKDVKDALQSIMDMEFDVREVNDEVLNNAVSIAFKYNVTVYDAYFLSLAIKENIPYMTADYKFIKRLKRLKNIILLSDYLS